MTKYKVSKYGDISGGSARWGKLQLAKGFSPPPSRIAYIAAIVESDT